MYCSSCGVAVTQGLNFCNYCGAKTPSTESGLHSSREIRPLFIVSVMAGVFVLGLPGIVFLIFMLKAVGIDPGQTMAFAWTSMLLLMALEAVFLMLILVRRKPRKDESRQADQFKGPQTKELEANHGGAPAEPVASVTEHTTRAFDPIPRERN